MVDSISASLSGLTAASKQVNASASNIANAGTVGAINPSDGPAAYQPVDVVQTTNNNGGVTSTYAGRDPASVVAYQPNSPYADSEGLVSAPNVDLTTEVVNLKLAEIAYKANLTALRVSQDLTEELLTRFDFKA